MDYEAYRSGLRQFPSSAGNIAYFDKGEGKTILLLHGVPTSSWLYRNISEGLVSKGYRVIAPDMLGFGASDKPRGYEIYSAKNHGQRILELMDFLKISSWTQVFHDGGGLWTWEMIQQNPNCVTQLVMLNTIVYQEGFRPPIKFERGWIAKLYSKLYSFKLGQFIVLNATFKNGVYNKSVVNKQMLEGYKNPLIKNGHFAMYYFFTQTCQLLEDYSTLHKSLDIPLSVIWGKHDDMLVWEKMAPQVKKNFQVKEEDIHILEAKHFIQEEKPTEIIGIIAGILQ